MSHALARLRRNFDDDLFVRSGKGMTLTPRALELEAEVNEVIAGVERLYARGAAFSPANASGRFVLASTDYLESLLLPPLLAGLVQDAPQISIVARPTMGQLPKIELEAGTIDVAIAGFFGDLPEGFFRRVVLTETYLCVVRKDHPTVRDALTLPEFLKLNHILVSPQGDLDGAVDLALAKRHLKRRIIAGVSNFHTPAALVANSDAIATLPARLALLHARSHNLKCLPPPLAVPGFKLILVWHARTDKDPMRSWMRRRIADTLATLD